VNKFERALLAATLCGCAIIVYLSFVAGPQRDREWVEATERARAACVAGGGRIRDQYTRAGEVHSWSCEGAVP
jgi:hypothetical protein